MKKEGWAPHTAVVQALHELTDEEHRRLALIATKLLRQEAYMNNGLQLFDLINEAVLGLMECDRGWFFKKRSMYQEIARILYSESSHRHEHFHDVALKTRRHVPYDDESHGDKLEGIEQNPALPGPARLEPESVAERDGLMEAIDDVVSDDPVERAVMVERLRGLKAKEIQRKLGLSPKQYESVMKRITYHARKTGVAEDLR